MTEQTALAKPETNMQKLRALARSDETLARFGEVLGSYNAPAYISSVILAVANNSALMECTPSSIISAAMRAATLRLSCDPELAQVYLIPYRDHDVPKARLQIGYKGLVNLAIRTGKYRYLNVAPVWDGQVVKEDQLRGIHFIDGFKKSPDAKAIGFMLYFELTNGFQKTYYMTVPEILEHAEKYSKQASKPDGFWKKFTVDMMKKTVLRAGLKRWGYFDPNDALAMAEQEPRHAEEEPIDIEFEDTTPQRTEAEIMSDLGFEAKQEQQPEKVTIDQQTEPIPTDGDQQNAPKRNAKATHNSYWKRTAELVEAKKCTQQQAQEIAAKYKNSDWPDALLELETTYSK